MLNRASVLICGVSLAAIAGCEATSHRVGQSATVHFGVVSRAEEVTLGSDAAKGAIIGGTIGMMAGRGSRAGGAITGAALGGAATAAAEGDRTGMAYTVQKADGSSTRIVSNQREIHVGDCVAVERVASSANIRRASADFCDPANAQAVISADDAIESEALACQAAKQELAGAPSEEALDLAIRKVELLCDS